MDIIVMGAGKVGALTASLLSNRGYNVTVIDTNFERLSALISIDVAGIVGSGLSREVLREANIDLCELFIAATTNDEANLVSCLIAKKLGAAATIARVENPELIANMDLIQDELGLTYTFNPEMEAALEISRLINIPSAINSETFFKGKVISAEFKVTAGSKIIGLTVSSLYKKFKMNFNVCTIIRGERIFIPMVNDTISENDKLFIIATIENAKAFFTSLNLIEHKIKNIMIVGAEKITYYLIKRLESFDYKIKVLESDNAKCENLFTQIKGVHIINADGSDPNVLTEEKINDADCFITLTKDDQANVIISLYAERSGVAKVITKLDRPMNITESIGIDTVVSPVISSASHVESYVRALDNSKGFSEIRSIYKLIGGKVEVLEFLIDRECALTRVPVGDLALKQNVMIACIEHHGRIIIPRKGDKIKKSDSVLVLTTRISEFTSPLDIL